MILRKKRYSFIILFILVFCHEVQGFFPINLFRSWDINLRPPKWCGANFQWTSWFEQGLKGRAFNGNGNEVNVMQVWTPTQDSLAMLKGFGPASEITQFLVNNLMNAADNGVRGHFQVTGKLRARGYGFNTRYHFPHNLTLGLFLPLYDMSLSKVNFADQTQNFDEVDARVKQQLTSRLQEVVSMFDPELNLSGWARHGFGDLTLWLEWWRHFPQGKPILKNVSLAARGAIILPTGLKTDEDDILSIPFGNDGSVGLLFGGGIDLTWFDHFRGGIDVEFLHLFGNTRDRRIKVQQEQTEFLLLAKTQAHKDFGFIQRFNLFLEAYRVWHGLSARATYQFWKESESKLTLCTNDFSNDIANTAQSLQEWTMHQAIFQINYDFQYDIPEWSLFKPQFSVFYKFPFNGQRSIMFTTVGATFTMNF